MFEGSLVAIVTPFTGEGAVDVAALHELVEWHIESGTDGIVPCGTTGENPTLSGDERLTVWKTVVDAARGRVPVVAGAGTNDTRETVHLCSRARELGADGVLVITPYYNKPTQSGLVAHFQAAAGGGLPVVMYNVPARTGVSLSLEATEQCAAIDGVVALKDATADMALASELHARCGDRLTLLSGDDASALPFWAAGGSGSISVTANVAPAEAAACWDAFAAGDLAEARRIHERLMPLHRGLFVESNPIPVKHALSVMGRCRPDVRLPLTPASPATVGLVAELLPRTLRTV